MIVDSNSKEACLGLRAFSESDGYADVLFPKMILHSITGTLRLKCIPKIHVNIINYSPTPCISTWEKMKASKTIKLAHFSHLIQQEVR